MSKLEMINANLNDTYKLIRDNIYSCIVNDKNVHDVKFHHQLKWKRLLSALKYGLLSYSLYTKEVEGRELTKEEKYRYSDEYHVNGLDFISLSSMDIDFSKMNKHELLWDTYYGIYPDIIVSSKVNAYKVTRNYFNEFLVSDRIPINMFNSIDSKLLRIFNFDFKNKEKNSEEFKINLLIKYYNYLIEVAKYIEENNLDIVIRETSEVTNKDENNKALVLDRKKVIQLQKIESK